MTRADTPSSAHQQMSHCNNNNDDDDNKSFLISHFSNKHINSIYLYSRASNLYQFVEQDRNVTVSTHIEVVPSTSTNPQDPPRLPSPSESAASSRPGRFDPLPVITTGNGNALPPNRLTQSSRWVGEQFEFEGNFAYLLSTLTSTDSLGLSEFN